MDPKHNLEVGPKRLTNRLVPEPALDGRCLWEYGEVLGIPLAMELGFLNSIARC